MKKESIALLIGYIDNQVKELESLFQKIRQAKTANKEEIVYLAYQLHNLYCAFEDLFKETAKTFENNIEDPSAYHRELIKRMIIDIPGIRPALLKRENYIALDELRGFRHVFRHSYTYKIDPARVNNLKNNIINQWNKIFEDINSFKSFLQDINSSNTEV